MKTTDAKKRLDQYTAEIEESFASNPGQIARELAIIKVRLELVVESLERIAKIIRKGLNS